MQELRLVDLPPSSTLAVVNCRSGCGACCVAPSISSPIPGMPDGKPAGIPCVQLLPDFRCALFGKPERPAVCLSLHPHESMCGRNAAEAMSILDALEAATTPIGEALSRRRSVEYDYERGPAASFVP